MALKAFVESLDGIDESLHEHYTEKDGGFYLALDDFGKHPGAVTLKTTLNRVNKDKEMLAAKVAEYEEKVKDLPEDFDPDEWARLKAGEGGKPDEAIQALKDQHARAIEALKAKYSKDLAEREAAVAERDRFIDTTIRNDELRRALREVGVDMDQHEEVLLDHLGKQVKMQRTDDGKRVALVETDLGEVPVSDFIKEWAGTKGKAYLGKAPPMDANGNSGHRGGHRTPEGDFGGDKDARKAAIKKMFPDLAQG